jgi:hypothetical protein
MMKKTYLILGNEALRNNELKKALSFYTIALNQVTGKELKQNIKQNIFLTKNKINKQKISKRMEPLNLKHKVKIDRKNFSENSENSENKINNYEIEGIDSRILRVWSSSRLEMPNIKPQIVMLRAQDLMLPTHILDCENLIVIVIPEHNAMSGGIYSMFSIAFHARRNRSLHGYEVVVMTRPNKQNETYIRNSSFTNTETVYRFDQILTFRNVRNLQLHIPEYTTNDFYENLSVDLINYLNNLENVHINILNQNIRLMPEPDKYKDLYLISDTMGQSVSHHSFFNKKIADYYKLPTLLLPAYTDLSQYDAVDFDKKEKIIIYSDDEAPYKKSVLEQLKKLDDYELIKIKDMTFDKYMELASVCLFSVSFGEGFDGYVSQPIYQGGIGIALYNDEFFPDSTYKEFPNFFKSENEMKDGINILIKNLESNPEIYKSLNKKLLKKWELLYQKKDYIERIVNLMEKKYEIYPSI